MEVEDDDVFSLNLEEKVDEEERAPERRPSERSLSDQQQRGEDWRLDAEAFARLRKEEAEVPGRGRRAKAVRRFYAAQNEQIDAFVSMDQVARGGGGGRDDEEAAELEARRQRGVQVAIYGSFVLNIVLFGAKVAAVVLSGSISLIASAVDSFLDLVSGSIIFITSLFLKRSSPYLYPAGNTRIEPIGVIIFASAMFVATFQIIVEAIQRIVFLSTSPGVIVFKNETTTLYEPSEAIVLDALTLAIMGSTVAVKFLMYLYCTLYRNKSSSVRALATDHILDVVSNSFLLVCYILAFYVWPYFDPLGGILLSFYLMFNWWREGKTEVRKLSGTSAPPQFLSQLTYLVWNHDPLVVAVDTVRAFFLANGFLVEVDIVLPHDMPLKEAHDIGESLQHKLEDLAQVERAYVHIDWESGHGPASEHPAMAPPSAYGDESSNDNEEDRLVRPKDIETQWNQEAADI